MSTDVIDSEKATPVASERQPVKPKGARKSTKRPRSAKKSRRAKAGAQPKAKRANKKAEVIDLMRRPGGAIIPALRDA